MRTSTREMLLLIESPFIKKDFGEALWVKVPVTYFHQTRTYSYPHKYLPYAASVVLDCTTRNIVKIKKYIVGIYLRTLDEKTIEDLNSISVDYDNGDRSWLYTLQPERNSDQRFSNINPAKHVDSKLFTDFLYSIVSSGLPSTGLRGNINKDVSPVSDDDDTCETC